MRATACFWLMACGASPQVVPPQVAPVAQSELELWAEERGATSSGQDEEFLAPGGSFVRELELGEGCHLFFVVGAPGIRDADLALWSPEGEQLVADEAPDARPVVQLCGARRVYARVNAPAGAGTVTLHHYRNEARLVLDTLGPGAATYEPHTPGALAQTLAARGFHSAREWTFDASEGEPVELGLTDERGCYAIIADRSEVVVRVLSGEHEQEVVRDAGNPAALQWCSPRQQAHRARVDGDGPVRVRLYRATEERVGGTPGLWLGDRSHAGH